MQNVLSHNDQILGKTWFRYVLFLLFKPKNYTMREK